MNTIEEITLLMNDADKKAFTSYLRKKNKRADTNNIQLFKLIETDDIDGVKKLYKGSNNNDAYHALRKRLRDSLVEFMANRTFERNTGAADEALRLLVVSRFFLEQHLTKTAFKCLAKAEAKAIPLEQFSLLNEIYHTRLQYAHLNPAGDLEQLIAKQRDNEKLMQQEARLNIAYALLRRELAEIQLRGKVVDFKVFIEDTMGKLDISLEEVLSYKSLYQILFIANEYATINHNFSPVEPFVKKSFEFIEGRKERAEGQLYYHIYILYFLANINFRNHRFADSEEYLAQMLEQVQKQGGRYYERFFLRHQLLLSLNRHFSGDPGGAIYLAEKMLKAASAKADPVDVNDLRVCLAMYCVQLSDSTAMNHTGKFSHSDAWYEKKLGMLWAIRKSLLEILMFAQFGHEELALTRLKGFKRRYRKYLVEVNEQRVMDYAMMVERYILKPEIVKQPGFKKNLLALINPEIKEDLFILSFVGWLLAKVDKKTAYQAAIDLIAGNN